MIIDTIELNFGRPVSSEFKVTPKGGAFGAPRHYGPHKGVDLMAYWGSDVRAIERGTVVFSDMVEGSKEKANYGNVIVIDHTPEADEVQRHIYSLSAHLDDRWVYRGMEIKKERIIGKSGNSGTRQSYSGKDKKYQKDYHLHFEIIDSPRKLVWNRSSWHPLSLRKDPMKGYIGRRLVIVPGPEVFEPFVTRG